MFVLKNKGANMMNGFQILGRKFVYLNVVVSTDQRLDETSKTD